MKSLRQGLRAAPVLSPPKYDAYFALVFLLLGACGGGTHAGDATEKLDSVGGVDGGRGFGSATISVSSYKATTPTLDDGVAMVTFDRVGCVYSNVGDCLGYEGCGTGPSNQVDLGDVSVGGTIPNQPITVASPDYRFAQSGPLFVPGAMVSVSASGGQISGFATSLTAPSQITVTTPTSGSGFDLSGDDLSLEWTGSSAGDVVVTLSQNITDTLNVRGVVCRFDATLGSGVVPGSVVRSLPGIDTVSVQTATTNNIVDAGWTIAVVSSFNSIFKNGDDAVVIIH